MAYKPQYYPGNTSVAKNRRKHMSGDLEKLRDISDEDLTAILGHRAPGSDYPSTHPPLAEMGEPDCPIREIVEPTPGAAAGDRMRYVQFADSMYNAPSVPYWRSYHAAINYKGVDPGTLSGRQVNEMRERDLEAFFTISNFISLPGIFLPLPPIADVAKVFSIPAKSTAAVRFIPVTIFLIAAFLIGLMALMSTPDLSFAPLSLYRSTVSATFIYLLIFSFSKKLVTWQRHNKSDSQRSRVRT